MKYFLMGTNPDTQGGGPLYYFIRTFDNLMKAKDAVAFQEARRKLDGWEPYYFILGELTER